MVGFMGMRGHKALKRKDADLDDLHHDFSDFSLSSPARKIRRLDAELPPIMEEEDELPEMSSSSSSSSAAPSSMEELELDSANDKAIVLFKPLNSPFLNSSPSNISVSLDSDLISGFKDQFIRATTQQKRTSIEEDRAVSRSSKECLAVVPWAPPSQLVTPPTASENDISHPPKEPSELTMEAEDSMEIEDGNEDTLQLGQSSDGYGGIAGIQAVGEGLPQWQQQHCMVPQPPHNISTPITWFQ